MDRWVMWVAVLAGLGFPVSVYCAVTAHYNRIDAYAQLHVLQMHDARMADFRQKMQLYKNYHARVQLFLDKAKLEGVTDAVWDRRLFNVENRMVTYKDLSAYIRKANHTSNYYFIPAKLELQTPEKAIENKVSGSVFQYYDRSKPILSLTMKGDFLVKNQ